MPDDFVRLSEGCACVYVSHESTVEIVRIASSEASKAQSKILGGPGYEGFEVWFRVTEGSGFADSELKKRLHGEHLFTLRNGWYVGPDYLSKYRIRTGRLYPCIVKVIEKGACTPVIFEFPDLDASDYSETKKRSK